MNTPRMFATALAPAALAIGLAAAATGTAHAAPTPAGPDYPVEPGTNFSTSLSGIEISDRDSTGARTLTADAEVCVIEAPYDPDGLTRVSPDPWSLHSTDGDLIGAFEGMEGSEGYDAFEAFVPEGGCHSGELKFLLQPDQDPGFIQYWNELGNRTSSTPRSSAERQPPHIDKV